MMARKTVVDIFSAALNAADPYKLVAARKDLIVSVYRREGCNKLFFISFGKAAFAMAKALTDAVPELITKGIVITKYGHVQDGGLPGNVEIFEAGHPVPDEKGYVATERVMEMLKEKDKQTLVICLVSGGGSALLVAPPDGISLREKQVATDLLLKAGANINELNTVRKHISTVKGGRLAELAYPSKVISLILSDVIGDPLDVIASGPTSPDESSYHDALRIIEKYGLKERIPDRALNRLERGAEGEEKETPKPGHPVFERVENIIIGSNKKATEAAAKKAREEGFDTALLSSEIEGEAREVAGWLAGKAMEIRKTKDHRPKTIDQKSKDRIGVCLISGGETTVTVKGNGIGGRNTELALAFAMEIEGIEGITLLSAGTDGTDGPTDAAGAVVDGGTIKRAREKGLDPVVYLANNDSYTFFKQTGELFITGSTGTNVMDIQIILIE